MKKNIKQGPNFYLSKGSDGLPAGIEVIEGSLSLSDYDRELPESLKEIKESLWLSEYKGKFPENLKKIGDDLFCGEFPNFIPPVEVGGGISQGTIDQLFMIAGKTKKMEEMKMGKYRYFLDPKRFERIEKLRKEKKNGNKKKDSKDRVNISINSEIHEDGARAAKKNGLKFSMLIQTLLKQFLEDKIKIIIEK